MISTAEKKQKELCKNCANLSGCIYNQSSVSPVYECEEFELDIVPLLQEVMPKPSFTSEPVRIFQDLCSTCDHLLYCNLKEENTIVLTCEQYN